MLKNPERQVDWIGQLKVGKFAALAWHAGKGGAQWNAPRGTLLCMDLADHKNRMDIALAPGMKT